ncbi:hypothetical protein MSPP1_000106 [Malassezia sp. CBS 17886]|nr:hypothetical protein MSPP1_000106 [Malassezia sp. CBS 17886]
MRVLTRGCVTVLVAGALLRGTVSWWTAWGEALGSRTELAPVVDRLELLRETKYLLDTMRVDPASVWSSLTVHHSPLLLLLPDAWVFDARRSAVLWIALDTATGAILGAVASLLAERRGKHWRSLSPAEVVTCYMLNPYAIACCAAKSTSALRALLLAASLLAALRSASAALAATQAMSSVLFLTPVLFTPALVLLGADSYADYGRWRATFGVRRSDAWAQFCARTTWRFFAVVVAALVLSAFLSRDGTWRFLRSVYGTRWVGERDAYLCPSIFVDNLAPSPGLVWYFFVQMFEHFRAFFVVVVNAHLCAYVVPVTIKFRDDPVFALTVLSGIQCLFGNYPSMGDTAMFLSLWSLSCVQLSEYLRYPLVTSMLFAYSTLLMPAFHYLWLYTGSANANFYYAVNLVHALAIGGLLLDATWAWGRDRWEAERPSAGAADGGVERLVVQR